jgi:hypothetical protein
MKKTLVVLITMLSINSVYSQDKVEQGWSVEMKDYGVNNINEQFQDNHVDTLSNIEAASYCLFRSGTEKNDAMAIWFSGSVISSVLIASTIVNPLVAAGVLTVSGVAGLIVMVNSNESLKDAGRLLSPHNHDHKEWINGEKIYIKY